MNPVIFREYDIRGIFGQTLFADDAVAIGAAFAQTLKQKIGARERYCITLGYDGRLSTPELKMKLTQGILSEGVDVIDIGLGPTPLLYFSVFELNVDGGIMITGSHNPKDHNGFKMMIGKSSLHGDEIKALGEKARQHKPALNLQNGSIKPRNIYSDYVKRLAMGCPTGKRSLKVAWDAGNGAAGQILPDLVKFLPGTHVLLNEAVDGNFPVHHPDPSVEENMRQLQQTVLDGKMDAGFAFDGDGDRLGVVDNRGRIFWGDQILLFLAEDIVARNPGKPIIADVKCSQILFDAIERFGGNPVIWKTGHSLIKSKMAELGAPMAGEMSGHIFIKDQYYGFDDGLYAAARFMQHLQNLSIDLATWRDSLPDICNTPEMRIECQEDRKFKVIDEVRGRLRKNGVRFMDIDGVRVTTEHGWWLLRASNTQSALALRAESNSPQGLEVLKSEIEKQLTASGVSFKLAAH